MRKWIIIIALVLLAALGSLAIAEPTMAPAQQATKQQAKQATEASASPTPPPTAGPWTFPSGTIIAGQDVGRLTLDQAQEQVAAATGRFLRPLRVVSGEKSFILQPQELGITFSAEDIVRQAQTKIATFVGSEPLQLPLEVSVDQQSLHAYVTQIAAELDRPAQLTLDRASRTFVVTPGLKVEVTDSVERLRHRLQSPDGNRRVTLSTRRVYRAEAPPRAQILHALRPYLEQWDGVVGIYVGDLDGNQLFIYNARTIFSGASVMKIPILLQSHLSLGRFSKQERGWMEDMIVESDNEASNKLLESIGRAEYGRSKGVLGLKAMNQSLRALGLERTYMLAPYESVGDQLDPDAVALPQNEGNPPFTNPDPYLQTVPAEMARLMMLIGQCAEGRGVLLEEFDKLSAAGCVEILELLERTSDRDKLVAGIPSGVRVAHKSGYISDTRADVGLVGDKDDALVFSIWLWTDEYEEWIPNSLSDPLIADITRTLYSAYYPQLPSATSSRNGQ